MPGIDGWGFLQEFNKLKDKLEKKIEIYIISSSNHPQDISRAKSIPEVKDYFQKPVTMELLKEITELYYSSKAWFVASGSLRLWNVELREISEHLEFQISIEYSIF